MTDNPKGMMLIRDEIAGFFNSMNKYNKGSDDCEFYLQCWSGGSFKGRQENLRYYCYWRYVLTICGTITAKRFKELLDGKYQDMGMSARILPCYPAPVNIIFPTKYILVTVLMP